LAIGAIGLAGCTGSVSSHLPLHGGGTTRAAPGDWDDVQAAVAVAAPAIEFAVVHVQSPTPDRTAFELLSARDEPGVLIVERGPGPGELSIRAQIGRFGDPARERALVEAVRRRLGQLRGVDAAPLE
jgi:hypothetical protein